MPSNLNSNSKRERAVLVVIPLLVFQLVLLSIQSQNPAGITPIKTLLLAVQAPIVNVSSVTAEGLGHIWGNYFWLVGAREENERLQKKIQQLTLLNNSYEQIRQENIRLRRLLSINEDIEYQTIGARVIARTPGFLSNVLYINRGREDGVSVDSPVISGDGIIGRTILAAGNQSQVQLITNPDASIGVMMERTRTLGVLRGSGNSILDLNYIGNAEEVVVGDNVLSSGFDTVFPKGFPVGKVVEAKKSSGVFQNIKVEPIVDLFHIEEVSVLLIERDDPGQPETP